MLGGGGVSGLYEVLSWMIYALAAVMMLAMIVAAILAGLAVRFVRSSCASSLLAAKRTTPNRHRTAENPYSRRRLSSYLIGSNLCRVQRRQDLRRQKGGVGVW